MGILRVGGCYCAFGQTGAPWLRMSFLWAQFAPMAFATGWPDTQTRETATWVRI